MCVIQLLGLIIRLMDPLFFAIIGTVLVIGSAIISQVYISRIERNVSKKEAEISGINKRLEKNHEKINRSYERTSPASIKSFLLKIFPANAKNTNLLDEIFIDYMHGLVERYHAGNDEELSNQELSKWKEMVQKALLGDSSSAKEYTDITNNLLSTWAGEHRRMVSGRTDLEASIQVLRRRTIRLRDISTTLQILGLIMVLLKDVFSTP